MSGQTSDPSPSGSSPTQATAQDPNSEIGKAEKEIEEVKRKIEEVKGKIKTLERKLELAEKAKNEKDIKSINESLDRLYKSLDHLYKDKSDLTQYLTAIHNERSILISRLPAVPAAVVVPENAYVALGETLADRKFGPKNPKLSTEFGSATNFPHVPLTVKTLGWEKFVKLCENDIEELKSIKVKSSLMFRKSYTIAMDEIGVSGFVSEAADTVFVYSDENHAVLPSGHFYATGSFEAVGDPDGQIGTDGVEPVLFTKGKNIGKQMLDKKGKPLMRVLNLTMVTEIKTDSYQMPDLGNEWCDYPCIKPKCESERHKMVCPSRQLYNYMVNNSVYYGLLCTYTQWVGLIRDCKGNLVITPALYHDQTMPLTVPQFLVLFCRMACRNVLPAGILQEGVLVECDDKNCNHNKLTKYCDVRNQPDKDSKGRKINGTPFDAPKGSGATDCIDSLFLPTMKNEATSIHDLEKGEFLGSYRTGSTMHTLIKDVPSIIKIADIAKHPDREEEIKQERKTYERLRDLWGKQVPSLMASGRLHENFLCALATSEEGSVPEGEMNSCFIESAKAALSRIHDHGVLHGDIRRENVLRRPGDGSPVIIDFGMSKLVEPGTLTKAEKDFEIRALENALRDTQ